MYFASDFDVVHASIPRRILPGGRKKVHPFTTSTVYWTVLLGPSSDATPRIGIGRLRPAWISAASLIASKIFFRQHPLLQLVELVWRLSVAVFYIPENSQPRQHVGS